MHWPVKKWLGQGASSGELDESILGSWAAGVPSLQEIRPRLLVELRRARRHERPAALLALGLDTAALEALGPRHGANGRNGNGNGTGHGKANGNGHAHPSHDSRLPELDLFLLGLLLRETLRETDLLALAVEDWRYVLFLPETPAPEARGLAARLLHLTAKRMRLPMRVGVSGFPQDGLTIDDLLSSVRDAWLERPVRLESVQEVRKAPRG